jgi:hypoxanthine-DNA glycosylase
MKQSVIHPWGPLFNPASRVLILGTMPSPRSREEGFYYAHPRNQFWPVMGRVLEEEMPESKDEKKSLMLRRHIALWDVLRACTIRGADDASIRDAEPNDIGGLIEKTAVRAVFTTGRTATALYQRYCEKKTSIKARYLPSTSPANCRYYTFEDLVGAYRAILPYINV